MHHSKGLDWVAACCESQRVNLCPVLASSCITTVCMRLGTLLMLSSLCLRARAALDPPGRCYADCVFVVSPRH